VIRQRLFFYQTADLIPHPTAELPPSLAHSRRRPTG
jgi:hypothetical protein